MRSWAAALLVAALLLAAGAPAIANGTGIGLAGQGSWIIIGKPDETSGLPVCRLCLNAFTGPNPSNLTTYQNLRVGIYPCWAFEPNEVWTYVPGEGSRPGAIKMQDHANATGPELCLTGVLRHKAERVPFPFQLELQACDPASQAQQWQMLEDGSVQSGIKWNQPLLIAGNSSHAGGKYRLFLQPNGSLTSSSSYTSYFNFLPVSSYFGSRYFGSSFTSPQSHEAVSVPVPSPDPTINFIRDGSFEHATVRVDRGQGSFTIADRLTLFPIRSWQVVRDAEMAASMNFSLGRDTDPLENLCIEYVKTDKWFASNGQSSIHLSCGMAGYGSAAISQTLTLQPNANYSLSFKMSGHPRSDQCPNSTMRHLRVQLYNAVPQGLTNFTYNAAKNSDNTMGWTARRLNLTTLANPVVIAFSRDPLAPDATSQCGPAIDDVRLNAIVSSPPELNKPRTGPGKRSGPGLLLLLLVTLASLGALLLGLACCAVRFCRGRKPQPPLSGAEGMSKVRPYTWKELDKATDGFSTRVGAGGYGVVYRATLPDGSLGAVKVSRVDAASKAKPKADVSVKEATILMRIHHRYLVNLIGYCSEAEPWPLVFEYLEGGSLFDRLHNQPENALPWRGRMKVALEVASALEYLHHGCNPQVLHRDVKSANVLLSKGGVAKLADFGLSKAPAGPTASGNNTGGSEQHTLVRGSPGYIDPAYEESGLCSAKSDVYSFGVLLLELVSGRPAFLDGRMLTAWAAPWLAGRAAADSVVDPRLQGRFYAPDLHLLLRLAGACLAAVRHARPTMTVVTRVLSERLQVSEPVGEYTTDSLHHFVLQNPAFQVPATGRMGNNKVSDEREGE